MEYATENLETAVTTMRALQEKNPGSQLYLRMGVGKQVARRPEIIHEGANVWVIKDGGTTDKLAAHLKTLNWKDEPATHEIKMSKIVIVGASLAALNEDGEMACVVGVGYEQKGRGYYNCTDALTVYANGWSSNRRTWRGGIVRSSVMIKIESVVKRLTTCALFADDSDRAHKAAVDVFHAARGLECDLTKELRNETPAKLIKSYGEPAVANMLQVLIRLVDDKVPSLDGQQRIEAQRNSKELGRAFATQVSETIPALEKRLEEATKAVEQARNVMNLTEPKEL